MIPLAEAVVRARTAQGTVLRTTAPWDTPSDVRYEIKMAAQASAYPLTRMAIRLDQAGIRSLYPDRRVQSIYFDTLDQTALEENLAGVSHREKLRFRWYGDCTGSVAGRLEEKVRQNMVGWKHVVPLPVPVEIEGATRTGLCEAIFSQLPEAWRRVRMASLAPVQWISYRREYYATADTTVRITIDRELRTYDLRARMLVSSTFPTSVPGVMIVEAKCAREHHDEAKRILNRFPLRIDKCSKFVIAARPDEGPPISIFD